MKIWTILAVNQFNARSQLHQLLPAVLILLASIFYCPSDAVANGSQKVLVLHSYHQGYLWTDRIQEGLSSALSEKFPKAEFYVEYMNTKRQSAAAMFPHLVAMYKHLYQNVNFNLIVASDNNALDFLLLHRDKLFPGVPVVFCGINDINRYHFDPAGGYTGVSESLDIAPTIDIGLRLHPGTKKVALITDATETGLINLGLAKKVADKFPSITFIELHSLTASQLSSSLKQLQDDTIVLSLAFFRDPEGRTFSARESMEFILSSSKRPVYTVWDFYMAPGALGGKLLSGRLQGENAASLAGKILSGEKAGSLAIIDSPTAYIFDYTGLRKFNIKETQLPEGALVTGRPDTIYSRYGQYLWFAAALFGIQIGIISLLLSNITHRRREQTARQKAEDVLRETNEIFSLFMRYSPVYVFIKELTPAGFRVLQASENFMQMVGIPGSEMIGRTMDELFPAEFAAKITADDMTVISGGEVLRFDEDLNGRSYATIKFPLVQGDKTLLAGFTIDNTERKRIEVALEKSELRFRSFIENINDVLFALTAEGNFTYVSPEWKEAFGYELSETVGKPFMPFVHPEDVPDCIAFMKQIMITGEKQGGVEYRVLCKDGKYLWYKANASLMIDPFTGTPTVVGIGRDITERKKMEETLEESQEKYRCLSDAAYEAIFISEKGLCLEQNKRAEELFGYSADEAIGRLGTEWIIPENRQLVMKNMLSGYELPYEVTGLRKDGSTFPALIRGRMMHFKNREVRVTSMIDITERKEHEIEQLKIEKLESLGILAGGIAHDFNNILTGIIGNISYGRKSLGETHESFAPLARAEKASLRAASLARQLLIFAKGGQPVKKLFSLRQVAIEIVSLVLSGTNIRGAVEIPDRLHALEADEGQISQALHNIVINAVQSMPDGGVLTINGDNVTLNDANELNLPGGNYVKLSFSDEGCGISEADQLKIFDPYFTTKEMGTGLGLASTYAIINCHGGRISILSSVGRGTTVTIHLPSVGTKLSESSTPQEPALIGAGGGSVLVMDDEEMIRELAMITLGRSGYTVTTCSNGKEAISLYREASEAGTPFSVVLMDLTIPGSMGGVETARQILAFDPDAPLVVSSGYSADPVMSNYREYGFIGAIEKPYNMTEFKQLLDSVLNKK